VAQVIEIEIDTELASVRTMDGAYLHADLDCLSIKAIKIATNRCF